MHTSKAFWLGSLALLLATLPTSSWAQGRGQEGPKGNAFVPAQKQRAHVRPALDAGLDRRHPGADTTYLDSDYRHHSLDQDSDRVHERRQHRHDSAAQPAADQAPATLASPNNAH